MADYDVIVIGLRPRRSDRRPIRCPLRSLDLGHGIEYSRRSFDQHREDRRFSWLSRRCRRLRIMPDSAAPSRRPGRRVPTRRSAEPRSTGIAFGRLTPTKNPHLAKAVIVATGSTLKDLGVPGEAKLHGPRRQSLRELRRAALQRPSRRRRRRRRLGFAGSADSCELCRARCTFSPGEQIFRATYLSTKSLEQSKDHRRAIEPLSKKFSATTSSAACACATWLTSEYRKSISPVFSFTSA